MVARAVAFVEMLVAAEVQEIEFVNQTIALEQIESTVNRDTMNAGIDFLRAFEDGARVQVAFRLVHDLEQDFSLAREAHAAFFESGLQAAGALVRVDAFTGGDSMGGCGGHVACGRGYLSRYGYRFRVVTEPSRRAILSLDLG